METKYSNPLLPAHSHAGGQGSRGQRWRWQGSRGTEAARAGLTGDRGGAGRAHGGQRWRGQGSRAQRWCGQSSTETAVTKCTPLPPPWDAGQSWESRDVANPGEPHGNVTRLPEDARSESYSCENLEATHRGGHALSSRTLMPACFL